MPPRQTVALSRDQLERAARLYRTNADASRALGLAPGSFRRMCQRYDIETPPERAARQRQEARCVV